MAKERERDGDVYRYDLDVIDRDGMCLERWRGVCFKRMRGTPLHPEWAPCLYGPYLQRILCRRTDIGSLVPAIEYHPVKDARTRAELVLERMGKHGTGAGRSVLAHGGQLTLCLWGEHGRLAAEVAPVEERAPTRWREVLDRGGRSLAERVARAFGEPFTVAAVRVLCAHRCIQNVGETGDVSIRLLSEDGEDLVFLGSGSLEITTCPISVTGEVWMLAMLYESAGTVRGSAPVGETADAETEARCGVPGVRD